SQFTARDYTSRLEEAGIAVSQDGRGRALDNVFVERLWRSVKYEEIYINNYDLVPELESGLRSYFWFYDEERPHSSLNYQTPGEVYRAAIQLSFRRWPQQFPAISGGSGDRLRQPVGPRVQPQQANDRTLRLRQLGHHHLGLTLTHPNFVPLDRREHLDQPVRRRTCAGPCLRIQRQRLLARPRHRLTQLPLQQRLHQ